MDFIQKLARYPGLLQAVDNVLITSLFSIAGLSLCLSVWVVPNMYLVPPEFQIKQLVATFEKGFIYLVPAGRLVMMASIVRTILTMSHPNALVSKAWTTWAMVAATIVVAAPYEIMFIFPVNDRAKELLRQVEKDRKPLTRQQEGEVGILIGKWKNLNLVRALLPFVAGLLVLLASKPHQNVY